MNEYDDYYEYEENGDSYWENGGWDPSYTEATDPRFNNTAPAADGGADGSYDGADNNFDSSLLDTSALDGVDEYGDYYQVYSVGDQEVWVYNDGSTWNETAGIYTDAGGNRYDADNNYLGTIDPLTGGYYDPISNAADGYYNQPLLPTQPTNVNKGAGNGGSNQGGGPAVSFGGGGSSGGSSGGGSSGSSTQPPSGTNQPVTKPGDIIASAGRILNSAGQVVGAVTGRTNINGPTGTGTGNPVGVGYTQPSTMPGGRGLIPSVNGTVQQTRYQPTGINAIAALPASTLLIAAGVVIGLILIAKKSG